MRRFLSKKEAVLLLVLAAAAVLALALRPRAAGGQARLTFADGSSVTLSLDRDGRYTFDEGRLPVTLQVKAGRVRFVDSVCPDHICEGFGWIFRQGQTAVCAPAGALLEISRENFEEK